MTEPVCEAFKRIEKETGLLVFVARCAVFPEKDKRDEAVNYHLRQALDYAHSLVDAVHELCHAMEVKGP